jgi:hypothetical protein
MDPQAVIDEIKRRNTRRMVDEAIRASRQNRRLLGEVLDAHYSPYALSGSPLSGVVKRSGGAFKSVAKKSYGVAKKEIVSPAQSMKRALDYKKKANAVRATGRIGRAAEMHVRADAVLRNRGAQLGGAVGGAITGATAGALIPGSTEAGALVGARAARKVTSKIRARHALRSAIV